MKPRNLLSCSLAALLGWLLTLSAFGQAAGSRTLVVTTTDNLNPPMGSLSLLQALTGLRDGDTIQFNIPGDGPHIIVTPLGGYPLITAHNITIDGYSQPGSSPNTNPILGGNNAKLRIVLDSSGAEQSGSPALPNRRSTRLPFPGYGDSENAILGVFEGDHFTVRGISFLARHTDGSDVDPTIYCVALVKEAKNAKIQGCWFGLAPDGTTLKPGGSAVAGFRHRVNVGGTNVDTFSGGLIFGTDGDGVNDVAEFNIATGMKIAVAIELPDARISGNYFNVYPDGRTFVDLEALVAETSAVGVTTLESIENGRVTDNTVIGTNGDGISDANERNIFAHSIYTRDIEFYTSAVNVVIAGNYFGVGVDGTTTQPPLVSATPDLVSLPGTGSVRIGSNGDGISDDLEANVIVGVPGDDLIAAGANVPVVVRRNRIVNSAFSGFPFADGASGRAYETYYATVLVDPAAGTAPVITAITDGIMTGTLPAPKTADFPRHVVDVYVIDEASTALGLTLPGTYAGSFVEGSAQDTDPSPNAFRFSLIGLPIRPGANVAIAVTYTKSAAGTQVAESITGPLSNAVQANIPEFTPGSIESVGLRRIAADRVVINPGLDRLGNWEPNASVLGNEVFLIEGNTFAEGTTDKQRYVVALQHVDGRPSVLGEGFFSDDGQPYKGQINGSRQNGNPGRVAGDKRPGAKNFMVGGEASPHVLPGFNSDNRWNLGFDRVGTSLAEDPNIGRYAVVQTFSLDTTTLKQTALSKALDAVNGRLTSGTSAVVPEVGRFGGDVAALDNGNFVVVVDDRSNRHAPDRAATAVILAPDGSVVKETFLIGVGQIWSNLAAYRGGFAVRLNGEIHFFDNAGTLQGKTDQNTSGDSFDRGRGDGTRIAAHIHSPYVFLAGKITTAPTVKVAAWDARDRSFVASVDVSEPAFAGDFDRVNLAVDALNRVTVSWVSRPAEYEQQQVAARVLGLNPTTKVLAPLTASFFPFINVAKTGGIRSLQMSVAMTTREICVAAKGEINLQNQPGQGANSPSEVNFYTVFSHPDPQADPTTPVGGGGGEIVISAARNGANLGLSWTGGAGPFRVQKRAAFGAGAWADVLTTNDRAASVPIGTGTEFFRVAQ